LCKEKKKKKEEMQLHPVCGLNTLVFLIDWVQGVFKLQSENRRKKEKRFGLVEMNIVFCLKYQETIENTLFVFSSPRYHLTL